jgi:hypothetical protein
MSEIRGFGVGLSEHRENKEKGVLIFETPFRSSFKNRIFFKRAKEMEGWGEKEKEEKKEMGSLPSSSGDPTIGKGRRSSRTRGLRHVPQIGSA